VWLGEAGQGSRMKLVVNAYMSILIEGVAEALQLVSARQFLYGLMEGEARQPFSPEPGEDWLPEARRALAAEVVNGLRYMSPVNAVDSVRANLLPVRSEIAVLAIRLSMSADKRVKAATERVSDAAGALVDHIGERDRKYAATGRIAGRGRTVAAGTGRRSGAVVAPDEAPETAAGGHPPVAMAA
jgi:hypothetical protein